MSKDFSRRVLSSRRHDIRKSNAAKGAEMAPFVSSIYILQGFKEEAFFVLFSFLAMAIKTEMILWRPSIVMPPQIYLLSG